VLFLLFICFYFFSFQIFAAPTVIINSVPDVITAGTTFPISFTVNEASSSASYFYKFFGGVDSDVYSIRTNPNLSYTSAWINFPSITLDPISDNIFNGYAYINSDTATNILNLKVKIASTNNTSISVTSPSFSIDVVSAPPTPTPTLIPTNKPTNTPTPTLIPTLIPTKILLPTPTPTPAPLPITIIPTTITEATESYESTLSASPTDEIYPTEIPPINGSILGENSKTKQNLIPLIFIVLGGLLLMTPLIISKIKKQ